MTNTISNVPRELLENLIEQHITAHGCTTETARQAQLMLSAPSPAGVDGLEVRATEDCRMVGGSSEFYDLVRLSEAQAIIDGLRGEVERLSLPYSKMCEQLWAAQQQRDQLAGLLREVHDTYRAAIHWEDLRGTMRRIDAALSAGKEGE